MQRNNKYSQKSVEIDYFLGNGGRVSPQAIPLEEAVLGALMLDKDAMLIVSELLRPEMFYTMSHQAIFSVIVDLHKANLPIDLLTVTEGIRKAKKLEEIGGAYYLVELTNRVASAANVEYHARIIAQKYIQREVIRVATNIVHDTYEDATDVFDSISNAVTDFTKITDFTEGRSGKTIKEIAESYQKEIEHIQNTGEIEGVVPTFREVRKIVRAYGKTDLVVVAARPSMGKTMYALNVLLQEAEKLKAENSPKWIMFFSLEMSNHQIVGRLVSIISGLSSNEISSGAMTSEELARLCKATEYLAELPIFIDDTPAISPTHIRTKRTRLKKEVGLIIVDYLQLMSLGGKGNREQEVATISRELKGIAKEVNAPVIALSQLSRAVESRGGTKKPQLSDLRECITGDTLIFMPQTGEYLPVKSLLEKKDFDVLSLNEDTLKLVPSKCLDIWETGEKEVFEVETQSGMKIRASINHPFRTINGWNQLGELKIGDAIATARVTPDTVDFEIRWEKIKSIAPVGREMTYDLHIGDTHNFVANNFIVHNSGALEQDADIVQFLYRPEYYQIMEDENGETTKGALYIITSKHRNGKLGESKLGAYMQHQRIFDYDDYVEFLKNKESESNSFDKNLSRPVQDNTISRRQIEDKDGKMPF